MHRASVLALVVLASCGSRASTPPEELASGSEDPPPASTASGNAILDAHNARRAEHCAPPLAWSGALASVAQHWADHLAQRGCQLEHSQSEYGENLAAGTTDTLSAEDVAQMWYAESAEYRYPDGGFSMSTGHFTQLVWVGSTSLGCAMARCDDLDVWVCNYDPPGNVDGEYETNVRPTSCR